MRWASSEHPPNGQCRQKTDEIDRMARDWSKHCGVGRRRQGLASCSHVLDPSHRDNCGQRMGTLEMSEVTARLAASGIAQSDFCLAGVRISIEFADRPHPNARILDKQVPGLNRELPCFARVRVKTAFDHGPVAGIHNASLDAAMQSGDRS